MMVEARKGETRGDGYECGESDAAAGAVTAVKGFLGIRSPSRLFMAIGEQTGCTMSELEGLRDGLKRLKLNLGDEE